MKTLEQDAAAGARTVSGYVAAAGTINAGTGYTVTKTGTGTYQLRFQPGFRAYVSFVATLVLGGFVASSWGPDYVAVSTYSSGAVAADVGFLFTMKGLAR